MKKQLSNNGIARSLEPHWIIKALWAATATVVVLWSAKVKGEQCRQQVWLISTRCAPLSGDLQSSHKVIRYWRLADDQQWRRSDAESFHASDDPAAPTTIVIHGNRIDADEAIDFSWPIYCRMLKVAQDRPFRLVIWSWPSQRMCRRNRPDVQLKFCYCDPQAFYLAECLEQLRGDVPVCLIGYSMGGRIIPGSLQLLAGGEVACRTLPGRHDSKEPQKRTAPLRALVVAAAVDDDSLAAHGVYNLALSQVQSLLIVRNCCDPVLKWYPKTYGRRGPEALGYVGPAGSDCNEKIELLDLTSEIGRAHKWKFYLASCSLMEAVERYTFLKANAAAGE